MITAHVKSSETGGKVGNSFYSPAENADTSPYWRPWDGPTSAPRVTQERPMSTSISNTDGGSQTSSRNGLGRIWLKITYQLTKPNSVDREQPGGLCDITTLGPHPPPTLSWASLTRNGQLLDLKLQVDRGVLIRFGSSSLETHGSLQTWELLGIYFPYIPR